jgi:hypothetical protein
MLLRHNWEELLLHIYIYAHLHVYDCKAKRHKFQHNWVGKYDGHTWSVTNKDLLINSDLIKYFFSECHFFNIQGLMSMKEKTVSGYTTQSCEGDDKKCSKKHILHSIHMHFSSTLVL